MIKENSNEGDKPFAGKIENGVEVVTTVSPR
jgi:hypothetical protein